MTPEIDNSYTIKLPSIQHLSKIAPATNTKVIKRKPSQPSHAPNFEVSIPVLVQCSLNDLCSLRLGTSWELVEVQMHTYTRGFPTTLGKRLSNFLLNHFEKGEKLRGRTATECISRHQYVQQPLAGYFTLFVKTSLPFKPMLASRRAETCIA